MTKTKIEWADRVWNPVTGCSKVSEGCRNCYAERIAKRFWGEREFTDVQCHPERLDAPLRWKKPARVFVNSMSDLFHEDVPAGFIRGCFISMEEAKQHIFIILTKRPERMHAVIGALTMYGYHPLSNVWLGVSIEDQKTADERIPLLLQTPAAKRMVSYEPALGKIDLSYFLNGCPEQISERSYVTHDMAMDAQDMSLEGSLYTDNEWTQTCPVLDWVIMGGESGPGARPMDIEWAHNIKNQCVNASVPFFLKQAVIEGKMVKLPELNGITWAEYPNE